MWVAFAFAKVTHIFQQNTCELDIVLTRTVNILATNELVKLTVLWTTGPRSASYSRVLCHGPLLLWAIVIRYSDPGKTFAIIVHAALVSGRQTASVNIFRDIQAICYLCRTKPKCVLVAYVKKITLHICLCAVWWTLKELLDSVECINK